MPDLSREQSKDAIYRDRMLNVLVLQLEQRQLSEITLETVARSAHFEMARATSLFSSCEGLVMAHFDRISRTVLDRLGLILASPGPAPKRCAEMLLSRVLVRWDAIQGYRANAAGMVQNLLPLFLERHRIHCAAEAKFLSALLSEAQVGARSVKWDPTSAASALITATNALIPYVLTPTEVSSRAVLKQNVERISALLLPGLFPVAGKPGRSFSGRIGVPDGRMIAH